MKVNFYKRERDSFLDKGSKFLSEVLSYQIARHNFLVEDDYQEVAKLQRDYDKQTFSMKEKEFSIQKQFSFIEDRWRKNQREAESLLEERNLIENALEEAFFVYEEKCRENALERKLMEWLKQTERKIRKIMYTAINGGAWDKK
uniref:Uncharacterized protein n=2 Tax=Cyphia TaxID=16404 RepID=A0A291F3Z1_9ASTR|nr:hypothetical protein Cyp_den1Pt0849 [Cyphia dentariifolia]YP_009436591.1 hypothetical protein Cyp_den1Pt1727 [Cyphia dentariifolia]ATG26637.1 hypothetical protein Cyp_bu_bu1Pt0831 [Cyphia bulbosa var. bulbosa]ATG26672.1 hypothetical protein Cyp_bu_bu1Pt1694 [Cyphia bulbosa var. bulbosa]ATG26833.1 hypothetical protein Cyp_den1Pt0849 [Cyphia dentariifolia]ATG26868.1 hypothetical protein Cyp_den1Pt1727 [Cyphia dentariifolia]